MHSSFSYSTLYMDWHGLMLFFFLSRVSSSTTVLYLQLFSYVQVSSVQQFSKIDIQIEYLKAHIGE
jgi:hypothetical protein